MPTSRSALPLIPARSHLDAALRKAEKSGAWLAKEIKRDPATISRYRGGIKPVREVREQIAEALSPYAGKPAEELLEEIWPA